MLLKLVVFFVHATAITEIYPYRPTLSLHDALPLSLPDPLRAPARTPALYRRRIRAHAEQVEAASSAHAGYQHTKSVRGVLGEAACRAGRIKRVFADQCGSRRRTGRRTGSTKGKSGVGKSRVRFTSCQDLATEVDLTPLVPPRLYRAGNATLVPVLGVQSPLLDCNRPVWRRSRDEREHH